MNKQLKGKKIAILATDGFEQSELMEPMKNLEDAGAKVMVLSIKPGEIKGLTMADWDRMGKEPLPEETTRHNG